MLKKIFVLFTVLPLHLCAMKPIELLDLEEDCIELVSPEIKASNTNDVKDGDIERGYIFDEETRYLVNLHRRATALIKAPDPDDSAFSALVKDNPEEIKKLTKDFHYMDSFGSPKSLPSLYDVLQAKKKAFNPGRSEAVRTLVWILFTCNYFLNSHNSSRFVLSGLLIFGMILTYFDYCWGRQHRYTGILNQVPNYDDHPIISQYKQKAKDIAYNLPSNSEMQLDLPKVLPWETETKELLRVHAKIVDLVAQENNEKKLKALLKTQRGYQLLLHNKIMYKNPKGKVRSFVPFFDILSQKQKDFKEGLSCCHTINVGLVGCLNVALSLSLFYWDCQDPRGWVDEGIEYYIPLALIATGYSGCSATCLTALKGGINLKLENIKQILNKTRSS